MISLNESVIYFAFAFLFFIGFIFVYLLVINRKEYPNRKITNKNITFILPCYNTAKCLEKTVESIKKSNYPQEKIKIIIVNDQSPDNLIEVAKRLQKKYPGITLINKKNGGKADSVNFGIRKSRTELVAVLDSDTLVMPDLIERTVSKFYREDTVAVTCRLKPINNSKLIERMQYLEYTLASFHMSLMGKANSLSFAPAYTMFRRKFFLEHGGFDKGNLTEDLEIALRVQKNHYNIDYILDSCAITFVPENFKSLFRQRVRWSYGTIDNYKNYRKMFFNKNYGELGVFFLPMLLMGIMIAPTVFLFGLYSIFEQIFLRIRMLLFGWIPSLNMDLNMLVITLAQPKNVLFILALIFGITFFFMAKIKTKQNIKLREYFIFVLFYLWFLALVYVYSFTLYILGKKPRW